MLHKFMFNIATFSIGLLNTGGGAEPPPVSNIGMLSIAMLNIKVFSIAMFNVYVRPESATLFELKLRPHMPSREVNVRLLVTHMLGGK